MKHDEVIYEQSGLSIVDGFYLLDHPCHECMYTWEERYDDITRARIKKEYVDKDCPTCDNKRFILTSVGKQLVVFLKRHV